MFNVPVTFIYDFEYTNGSRQARRFVMHEFAACGAKHIVLTDTLIKDIYKDPGLTDTLAKDAADFGITFVDSHAPFGKYLDLCCPYDEYIPSMIAQHKLDLLICNRMGVDTIAIHVGNPPPYASLNLSVPHFIDRIKHALGDLLPEAEKLGVTICIENIWFPTNTPEVLHSIKAEFPTDALGFCYDAGHANQMDHGRDFFNADRCNARDGWKQSGLDETPPWDDRILEKMLPHVVNCHLHDNFGGWDEHRNIGHGNIDWNHIVPLLKKAPRLKSVQCEVLLTRNDECIREVVRAFDELGEIE